MSGNEYLSSFQQMASLTTTTALDEYDELLEDEISEALMSYSHPQEHQQASSPSASPEKGDGYDSEQIGGGNNHRRRRSRSATPSETPTRLRVKVTPTTKAGLVAANALERRARLAPDGESPTHHDPPETSVGSHPSRLDQVPRDASIRLPDIPPSNPDPYAYMTRPSLHPQPDSFQSGRQPTEAELQLFQTFLHGRHQPGVPPSNYPLQHSHDVYRAPSRTPDPQLGVHDVSRPPSRIPDPQLGVPSSNHPLQHSRDVSRAPSRTPDPQLGIPSSNRPLKHFHDVSRAPSRTPDPQLGIPPSNQRLQPPHDVFYAPSHTPDLPKASLGPIDMSQTSFQPPSEHPQESGTSSESSSQLAPDQVLSTNMPLRPSGPSSLKPSTLSDLPIPITQVIPATPARDHANAHVGERKAHPKPVGRKSDDAKDILDKGIIKLEVDITSLAKESGYSIDQIYSKLGTTNSYAKSSWKWNTYLKYFKDHEAAELDRLKGESGVPDLESMVSLHCFIIFSLFQCPEGEVISNEIRSRCHEKFKAAYPDTWMEILETYRDLKEHDLGLKTLQQRTRDFNRSWGVLTNMVRSSLKHHLCLPHSR
jgi:hypothetical protein